MRNPDAEGVEIDHSTLAGERETTDCSRPSAWRHRRVIGTSCTPDDTPVPVLGATNSKGPNRTFGNIYADDRRRPVAAAGGGYCFSAVAGGVKAYFGGSFAGDAAAVTSGWMNLRNRAHEEAYVGVRGTFDLVRARETQAQPVMKQSLAIAVKEIADVL